MGIFDEANCTEVIFSPVSFEVPEMHNEWYNYKDYFPGFPLKHSLDLHVNT